MKKIKCKYDNIPSYIVLDDDQTFLGIVYQSFHSSSTLPWTWECKGFGAFGHETTLKDAMLRLREERRLPTPGY